MAQFRYCLLLGLLALTQACVDSNVVTCATAQGERLCPADSVCVASGCAAPAEAAACANLADSEPCSFGDRVTGECEGGACREVRCGDGTISRSEACDDRNLDSGDGCSADCKSNEICGNGYVDGVRGEQCDNGLRGLSRDGCTSDCRVELEFWSQKTAGELPPRRATAAVFDRLRNRVVLFGGRDDQQAFADTWQFDGRYWSHDAQSVGPSARSDHAMVYDSQRQRTILFGGTDSTGNALADTWIFDATGWHQLMPATAPPTRSGHSMAYDSGRDRIVLFGGQRQNRFTDDTWEFDGANWQQIATTVAPAPGSAALVYNIARSRIVLIGGGGSNVWTYNPAGPTWSAVTTTGTVPGGFSTSVAYDQGQQAIVMNYPFTLMGVSFVRTAALADTVWLRPSATPPSITGASLVYSSQAGGILSLCGQRNEKASREPVNTTAIQNSDQWSILSWFDPLEDTGHRTAVFDTRRGRVLVLGGAAFFLRDATVLFEFDGQTWNRPWLPIAPPPRVQPRAVYAATSGRTLMFGGFDDNQRLPLHDAWSYDGTQWRKLQPATVPPFYNAMVYDSARDVVVMVGNSAADMWEYSNDNWTQRTIANAPAASSEWSTAQLVYDARRLRLIAVLSNATWEFDGQAWTESTASAPVPARFNPTVTFDRNTGRVVLFGGENVAGLRNDTWEYDGVAWLERTPPIAPPARTSALAVYDAVRRAVILMQGIGPISGQFVVAYQDIWAYDFRNSARPAEACLAASADTDMDGLAGCLDPDCWGRCTPDCAPGQSCGSDGDRCGDGMCNPFLESVALCPTDC